MTRPNEPASLEELRTRLAEAEEILEAIRSGAVDALVVRGEDGEQVYTLSSADRAFRQLAERMSDGAATISEEGVILWANQQLANLAGRPLERLIGESAQALGGETDSDLSTVIESGRMTEEIRETNLRRPDGSLVPIRVSVTPVNVEGVAAVAVVVSDLTDRRRTEAFLRESAAELERRVRVRTEELSVSRRRLEAAEDRQRRLLGAVTAQLPIGIIVVAPDGSIIYRNAETQRIWRKVANSSDLEFPLSYESFEAAFKVHGERSMLARVLAGQPMAEVELTVEAGDGRPLKLLVASQQVVDEQDVALAAVFTVVDVTDRREAEAIHDAFIDVTAHELKTPLTTLLGSLQALGKYTELSGEVRLDLVEDAAMETERLIHFVNDLLVLSRVERGVQFVADEPLLLDHLLKSVVAREFARSGISPTLRLSGSLPVVRGEATYVEQIVSNYLRNALKYGRPPIDIGVDVENEGVTVRVLDRGEGFTSKPEELFDLYFREGRARSQAGAGIGLFVCRELAKMMDGRVWAANRSGGGAEFGLWLPLYVVEGG